MNKNTIVTDQDRVLGHLKKEITNLLENNYTKERIGSMPIGYKTTIVLKRTKGGIELQAKARKPLFRR